MRPKEIIKLRFVFTSLTSAGQENKCDFIIRNIKGNEVAR